MSKPRELLPPTVVRKPLEEAAAAGLNYPSTEVGTVGNISVYYATSLGTSGDTLANALLDLVAGPYSDMEAFFDIAGGPVTVVVAPLSGKNDGSGGAYHYGCDFASGGTLYLDATFALPNAADVELALYVAELSECFMGAQGLGWGCGFSNGEGLSRFCAEVDTPPGSFPSWGITGPSWVSAGYPDWVNTTEQTDRNYVSTGCAVLYLYWMLSLGYSKEQVIQAGGATLADNYQKLTGKNTAYADLKAAVQAVTVTSDNPFYLTNLSLWTAFIGTNADHPMVVCPSADGKDWTGNTPTGQYSSVAPSLAVFHGQNSRLYCAYVAISAGNPLWICSSEDGATWSGNTPIGQAQSPTAPSLAAFHRRLYCAYVADDGTGALLVRSTADGVNWSDKTYTGHFSATAPSLAVFNGQLYCAYVGIDGTGALLVTSTADGVNWSDKTTTGHFSATAPSLATFNGQLYCAYVGIDGTGALLVTSTADGVNWSGKTTTGQYSSVAPSLAGFNGQLYCAYVAIYAGNPLWICSSEDGVTWPGNTPIGQLSATAPSLAAQTLPS